MNQEVKRALTPAEIKEILDYVLLRKRIPEDIAIAQQQNIQSVLREQLECVKIYPSKINDLKQIIERKFLTTQIPAGSMIGALAATSIGEPMTQLVLNSFHSSGIAKSNVTTGIPRMEELINVTSNNKMCGMRIYLKDNDHTDVVSLRNICKQNIEHLFFEDLLKERRIVSVDKLREISPLCNIDQKDFDDWHDYHSLMVSDDYKTCQWSIVFEIDKTKLFQVKKTLTDVADIINACVPDVHSVCSDEQSSIIISYVSIPELASLQAIEKKKNKNTDDELYTHSYINEENKHYYYLRNIILPEILKQTVSGVVGVTECIFDQPLGTQQINNKKVWVVNTRGSNFRDILSHPLIDHTRTTTSRLKEVESVLGIEAARVFLLNEFASIISSSKRHIEQLVNCMTFTGKVRAANRHGIDKSVGLLAQMSFEQPIKNAIDASIHNDIDNLSGVSSQLMLGKYAKVGTGYVNVILDTEKLLQMSAQRELEKVEKGVKVEKVEKENKGESANRKDKKSQFVETKVLKQTDKKQRTNVGEVVARKVFTKSQLKVQEPRESCDKKDKNIFKTDGVIEKKKYEKFYTPSTQNKSTQRTKVTDSINDDIQEKTDRAVNKVKIGFFNKPEKKVVADVVDF